MRKSLKVALGLAGALAIVCCPPVALAGDVTALAGDPVKLDVTETTVVSQQFDARQAEGEKLQDHGYGAWVNRLNAALGWGRWQVGLRLDSSLYWRRPVDQPVCGPGESGSCIARNQVDNVIRDDSSRYRDYVYPAKIFVKYTGRDIEAVAGDAYVQFGRGFVLSLRKVDELGADTSVRGGKVTWTHDPFSVTLVGGILNPTRIDEATGRALVLPRDIPADPSRNVTGDRFGPQPIYGSDRVVGAQIQAGRGLPVLASTHVARFTRCAPYRYDENGRVIDSVLDAPVGTCDPRQSQIFLATLPQAVTPTISASEIFLGGQSLEVPSLGGHGSLYVEAAVQRRRHENDPNDPRADGNALYGSASANAGKINATLEVKSYRNFYPVAGAVDQTRASAFSNVAYTILPNAEVITQDSALGFFNACVDGGRLRTDYSVTKSFRVYGQGIYSRTKTELNGGQCDKLGRSLGAQPAADTTNNVWDGLGGIEWIFDDAQSQLFTSAGARDDTKENGEFFYREVHAEYTLTKRITGPYSLELTGRHRLRKEETQNIRGSDDAEEWWRQGEHYTALKIAPKWVIAQGFEYTSLLGFPTYYFNGNVLYRFSSESNLKVFFGQQRGGLKCVSGICKVFPTFEGARVELTLRF